MSGFSPLGAVLRRVGRRGVTSSPHGARARCHCGYARSKRRFAPSMRTGCCSTGVSKPASTNNGRRRASIGDSARPSARRATWRRRGFVDHSLSMSFAISSRCAGTASARTTASTSGTRSTTSPRRSAGGVIAIGPAAVSATNKRAAPRATPPHPNVATVHRAEGDVHPVGRRHRQALQRCSRDGGRVSPSKVWVRRRRCRCSCAQLVPEEPPRAARHPHPSLFTGERHVLSSSFAAPT